VKKEEEDHETDHTGRSVAVRRDRAQRGKIPHRDLGGLAAAANPMHIPLRGPAANAVTRGYHLAAMSGSRMRVLTDWTLNAIAPQGESSVAAIGAASVRLDVNHPRE
jgi:NADH:ubiquinone reductase (H+-translocating)